MATEKGARPAGDFTRFHVCRVPTNTLLLSHGSTPLNRRKLCNLRVVVQHVRDHTHKAPKQDGNINAQFPC